MIFSSYSVRGVLAGAYKGGGLERTLLTHLVIEDENGAIRSCCKIDTDHLVDAFGEEDADEPPMCQSCLRVWNRIKLH